MIRTARLKAYAKLNLGLRILYKRADGYHELRTIFQTISLADDLEFTFARSRRTRIQVKGATDIPDNVVERATALYLQATRIQADVTVFLKKNIPRGSGLGGGSSDAAATLLALSVLAGDSLPKDKLNELAVALGSDVPFFLHGGTALGLGRGEELYPLPDRPRAHALLITPAIHSSTAEAYRNLSSTLTPGSVQHKLISFQQDIWSGAEHKLTAINDFEETVFARHPQLRLLKRRLLRLGATTAAMTGSGSAIFGIFEDSLLLTRAKESFPKERVFAISFVNRAQYRSSWNRALEAHMKGDDLWPPQSQHAR